MNKVKARQKVILFACNWQAYNSLEAVSRQGWSYPAAVVPIRVSCLGRISPGIILKAFQDGAAGVLLMGCPEGECRHENGNIEAHKVVQETKPLLKLLGYGENRLAYQLLPAESGDQILALVNSFLKGIENGREIL